MYHVKHAFMIYLYKVFFFFSPQLETNSLSDIEIVEVTFVSSNKAFSTHMYLEKCLQVLTYVLDKMCFK